MDNKMGNNTPQNNKNGKKYNPFLWIYLGLTLGIIFLLFGPTFNGTPQPITWPEFEKMLKNQEIQKIVLVNREYAEITLKPEAFNKPKYSYLKLNYHLSEKGPHFKYVITSPEIFYNRLQEAQKDIPPDKRVYFQNVTRQSNWKDILNIGFTLLLLFFLWFFMFRGMGGKGGIFSMGKSRAKLFEGNQIPITFDDVAGLEEAKQEVVEIVNFLKNPQKYTRLGGKIPKGVLLIGPPGTGKTLLARAVAGEAHVPFFSLSGSDFVEMFVGVGASRVRDLFAQAKAKAPCIVFIDEIDAIGRSRSTRISFSSNDERENTLNALLTEMDGFEPNQGIIVMGATNRPEILDKALLRAGRFDRQIFLDLPNQNERAEIFKVHTRNLKLCKDIDLMSLAKQTPGFSGADIANTCNEAALIAARKNKDCIAMEDFIDAIDKIVGGLEKKSKIISPEEKKRVAYHEAGHATVSWMIKYGQPLIKVSIVPRGKSLGAAWYMPDERQLFTESQFKDEICSLLGGRAAEEVIFGEISSGAMNDLERATKRAYSMVAFLGMSKKLPNLSFFDSSGQTDYTFQKPYSEKTAEVIDQEVKQIIAEQYERAKKILLDNQEKFSRLAEELLKNEVIFTDDVERILGPRPFAPEQKEVIENIISVKKKSENTGDKENDDATPEDRPDVVIAPPEENNIQSDEKQSDKQNPQGQ